MIQVIDAALPPDGITHTAKQALEFADKRPYDEAKPVDAAHRTAQGILADLCGRRGIRQELEHIDADVKVEIVAVLSEIIRLGMAQPSAAS
ncbi:hypothetical protein [Ralstonia pickettii]|uniref:Uncharacterized protein n=1 Tax=Ralstonia pickettii TaxID=329 RepID=A0AAW4Q7W9_RALPI|nr:hypothetical protein [Ralstonia pickettii]MBA9846752.1 hypothetical protein [Ralstonia pickettii]MBA9852096.1 hypothetical protein [Ralstonia pickettii]MBA9919889.1 hypothetical protein [Ralstonia pickettii]MBA9958991.1 hypothetical protein [Ralstonia pickettii]MBA9964630.1 hypothetical protein [Ralstonia pickettii]